MHYQKVNSMNFTNVKIKAHPGVWGLAKLSIGVTGPKILTKL